VSSAVDEMLWTFRAADMLKRQAGIATGGSKLDKPVRHISLSWPQGEAPTQEHMTETVQAYLKFMGWADRQAVMVSHNDTKHAHVHVVINSVSPEDGRALKSSHDWRRSEDFALHYEREHGQIHCEQRLKKPDERDASPTRETWQRFKKSEIAFERGEIDRLTKTPGYFERHDAKTMDDREWKALKGYQQKQREQFFMDGKEAFRAIRKEVFREVRQEFRGQWNAYYAALRNGENPTNLAATKAALLDAQRKVLDERRIQASDALREQRDRAYEAILEQQRFDRAELGRRQAQGLRTYQLFDVIYPTPEPATPLKKEIDRAQWRPRAEGLPERSEKEKQFNLATEFMVDPYAWPGGVKGRPEIVQRSIPNESARQATDAFGRELREAEIARAPRPNARAAEDIAPRGRATDTTSVASEKTLTKTAREMNEQRETKEQDSERVVMRASWNRSRSRGGRD
jgi:hypothetical protein